MSTVKLVRRDTPLAAGRKIQMRVVTYYEVEVDEFLNGEASVTVDDIETALGGKYRSSSEMAKAARRGDLGKPSDGDVEFIIDIPSREFGMFEARFESEYEAQQWFGGRDPYGCEYVVLPVEAMS
jgi:hypothetical protein